MRGSLFNEIKERQTPAITLWKFIAIVEAVLHPWSISLLHVYADDALILGLNHSVSWKYVSRLY